MVKEESIQKMFLKTSEALSRDVGRGIARIDPEDMKILNLQVGDIIKISGKRETVAKIMPAYMEQRGKGIVQIDGITRTNAQVGLDEKVLIILTKASPAVSVVLKPLTLLRAGQRERDIKYIGRLIEGLPVIKGDRVRANLFGTLYQEFTVMETQPGTPVIIEPTTVLKIKTAESTEKELSKISYEDIGGLGKEIQRVREMIELPLKYPQIFERLGIEAPKGVLLHGPPGCGKTLIARAVAHETDAHFYAVNGPEVIHKFYGESEAKLRKIFDDASKYAPSIIFLDEIDAIAPKRESVVGEVEKRVVAQLLALMDGLESRGQVIVIGATNIPNSLDPALRRPGRFDREIVIGIPDRNGRKEILEIHTRGMPLSEDVNLDELADITHGFVGADIEALCREAAMIALRGILPSIDFDQGSIPYETLMELKIFKENFYEALKEIEPSGLREIYVEIPNVRWEDIGGLESIKQQLREIIEWPLKYGTLLNYAKAKSPKGVLLYGPPGTGKTLLAKAVATESQSNFITVKGPALMSKWVGESEKGIREVFKKAKQASPCIIFLDEIDSIAPKRGTGADSHVTERVISQLLTELDGIEELKGVVVLAATNKIDIVDPALLRPGRFDFLLKINPPDEQERLLIYKVHHRGKPLDDDVDINLLAKRSEKCTGAEIEAICQKATMIAIREYLDNNLWGEDSNFVGFKINMKHFLQALEIVLNDYTERSI